MLLQCTEKIPAVRLQDTDLSAPSLALKEKDLACAQCQLSACAVMRMKHAQSLVWATGRHNPPQIRNSYTDLYRWGTLE